jgi:hypothetical protein
LIGMQAILIGVGVMVWLLLHEGTDILAWLYF